MVGLGDRQLFQTKSTTTSHHHTPFSAPTKSMSLHRRILLSPYANGADVPCFSPLPDVDGPSVISARRISNAAIASVSAASAAAFLALVYYSVLHRRRRRRGRGDFPAESVGGDDTASDSDGGEALDGYHVWNIRTVGLDDSAITSIGSYAYLPGGGNLAADCPVCLGQFQGAEMVRLLPKCGHVFHVPCIDTWLKAHVTCPICRAYVLSPEEDLPAGLEEEGVGDSETRVRVLAVPDAPPEAEAAPEIPMDPSVTAETGREERNGEERKEENLGEKEIGGVSSSSGSGRGIFGKVGRCRSSSVIPL